MQAHFASRMKEEVFWHNYFMHTRVVRVSLAHATNRQFPLLLNRSVVVGVSR